MRLAYWPSVWFDGLFTPSTGKARRRFIRGGRPDSQRYPGYFAFVRPVLGRRTTVALYLEDDLLFFQAGKRRWPLTQRNLGFRYELLPSKVISRFRVLESNAVAWRVTYLHPLRTGFAMIDPAYDESDFANDHFLSFAAEHALDLEWQSHVRKAWGELDRGFTLADPGLHQAQ